ncbi:hypothetical protein GA0070612_0556 [Micromonospora chokoriensis]|uniref:Secreted protein n=1 Tax=Micromonospora chokoriensis TaxID=356851 RepID=A0A1C4ULY7_9ACTN|nr:hypothetical protein GA0070612_0556 [Micromonospora chokoriensis]
MAVGLVGTAAAVAGAAAEDVPTDTNGGSIVEDFAYPGAAAIKAEQGITLISGDGHIILVACSTPPTGDIGLLRVRTTDPIGPASSRVFCFKILANTGYLKLELPTVYEIRGDGLTSGAGHEVTATVATSEGVLPPVQCDPDGFTQVGEGINPENDPTTLLELKVTG